MISKYFLPACHWWQHQCVSYAIDLYYLLSTLHTAMSEFFTKQQEKWLSKSSLVVYQLRCCSQWKRFIETTDLICFGFAMIPFTLQSAEKRFHSLPWFPPHIECRAVGHDGMKYLKTIDAMELLDNIQTRILDGVANCVLPQCKDYFHQFSAPLTEMIYQLKEMTSSLYSSNTSGWSSHLRSQKHREYQIQRTTERFVHLQETMRTHSIEELLLCKAEKHHVLRAKYYNEHSNTEEERYFRFQHTIYADLALLQAPVMDRDDRQNIFQWIAKLYSIRHQLSYPSDDLDEFPDIRDINTRAFRSQLDETISTMKQGLTIANSIKPDGSKYDDLVVRSSNSIDKMYDSVRFLRDELVFCYALYGAAACRYFNKATMTLMPHETIDGFFMSFETYGSCYVMMRQTISAKTRHIDSIMEVMSEHADEDLTNMRVAWDGIAGMVWVSPLTAHYLFQEEFTPPTPLQEDWLVRLIERSVGKEIYCPSIQEDGYASQRFILVKSAMHFLTESIVKHWKAPIEEEGEEPLSDTARRINKAYGLMKHLLAQSYLDFGENFDIESTMYFQPDDVNREVFVYDSLHSTRIRQPDSALQKKITYIEDTLLPRWQEYVVAVNNFQRDDAFFSPLTSESAFAYFNEYRTRLELYMLLDIPDCCCDAAVTRVHALSMLPREEIDLIRALNDELIAWHEAWEKVHTLPSFQTNTDVIYNFDGFNCALFWMLKALDAAKMFADEVNLMTTLCLRYNKESCECTSKEILGECFVKVQEFIGERLKLFHVSVIDYLIKDMHIEHIDDEFHAVETIFLMQSLQSDRVTVDVLNMIDAWPNEIATVDEMLFESAKRCREIWKEVIPNVL